MTGKQDSRRKKFSDQLGELDACAVSDALEKLGKTGTALGLSRMATTQRIVGPVRTVQLGRVSGSMPNRHLAVGAIESSEPGDVIIVANGGDCQPAAWGGLLTVASKQRGVVGVVVDGAFRDVDECEQLAFPVFARSTCPTTARGRLTEISSGAPIVVSGVTVHPGDLVVADGTGVVFIGRQHIEQVVETAREILQKETELARKIREGHSLGSVLGERYESMLTAQAHEAVQAPRSS